MKVYILDWRGTLDRLGKLPDIEAFLDKLHERGDYTIGYSSMLPKWEYAGLFTFGNSKRLPEHLRALDPHNDSVLLHDPEGPGFFDSSQVEEIVISDDDPFFDVDMLPRFSDLAGGIPIRFVEPEDLAKEV